MEFEWLVHDTWNGVDAAINDDRSWLDPVPFDHLSPTDGRNNYISFPHLQSTTIYQLPSPTVNNYISASLTCSQQLYQLPSPAVNKTPEKNTWIWGEKDVQRTPKYSDLCHPEWASITSMIVVNLIIYVTFGEITILVNWFYTFGEPILTDFVFVFFATIYEQVEWFLCCWLWYSNLNRYLVLKVLQSCCYNTGKDGCMVGLTNLASEKQQDKTDHVL